MEQEIFTLAVQRYQNMIFRIALHYFGDTDDADDAVQEVFFKLYLQRSDFESEEHLKHWLMRVAINYCKDSLRSPWRKRRISLEAMNDQPVFDRAEESALFREVMALPEKYRTVLNLFYYEELSTQEIAALLDVRQSAVTTRLSRARAQLKKRLGDAWNDDE